MSLYTKILTVALLPLIILFGVGLFQIQNTVENYASALNHNYELKTAGVQKSIKQIISQIKTAASVLSESEEISKALQKADNETLFNMSNNFINPIDSIIFTDISGLVIARAPDEYRFGDTITPETYFNKTMSTGNFFGIAKIDGSTSFVLSKTIKQYDDIDVGMVCIAVNITPDLLNSFSDSSELIVEAALNDQSIRSTDKNIPFVHKTSTEDIFIRQPDNRINFNLFFGEDRYYSELLNMRKYLYAGSIFAVLILGGCLVLILNRQLKPYSMIVGLIYSHADKEIESQTLKVRLLQIKQTTGEPISKIADSLIKMLDVIDKNFKRYESAQRMGQVGNWEYDLITKKFWASDEAKRIYGFDPENDHFTTDEVENCIPERKRVHQALIDLIEKNQTYDLEFEIHPVNGPKLKIIKSIAELELDDADLPYKVLGVVQDITQRKEEELEKQQLEVKLLQAQKIEAIGTLAGGIAHDFNNILYPIIGFTEMSMQDLPENHPVQENLQDIFQGAKRARDLVKQILAFSNQRDLEHKPLALQNVIIETLKLLRSIIPSNILIEKNLPKNDIYLFANSTEFHEVVMNVCTNAYHAMEATGGVLTLNLEETPPGIALKYGNDRYCCLTISDTGTGIPPEILDNIYDPYFTTKEQGKGSGLGLSVVHGIVKSYKGAIDITSETTKGTAVKIFFPMIPKPDVVDVAPDDQSIKSGNENILLVDDEPDIVKLGILMLERSGYNVTGKTDSTEALELFRSNPDGFDLVITDMTMPSLLGTELAREMLKIRQDISVLICTGFSERVNKNTAESLGIKGYINKPVLMQELTAKVREVLDEIEHKPGLNLVKGSISKKDRAVRVDPH